MTRVAARSSPSKPKKAAAQRPAQATTATAPETTQEPVRETMRQRLAAATRGRIFRVALAEFAEKGLSGARVETIASRAKVNIRMIYHYFGGKEALYLEVLEFVLGRLRAEELKLELDVDRVKPVEGIVLLYEFIEGHFAAHQELGKLLSFENLNRARVMKRSKAIPEMASPVLVLLRTLIERGAKDKTLRPGLDPLHLYVALVSLCSFHKSNAYTLSCIFNADLLAPSWQDEQKRQAQEMVRAFVRA